MSEFDDKVLAYLMYGSEAVYCTLAPRQLGGMELQQYVFQKFRRELDAVPGVLCDYPNEAPCEKEVKGLRSQLRVYEPIAPHTELTDLYFQRPAPAPMRTVYVYRRVIPRDLFNESKLLKCLGQLSLLAHDQLLPGLEMDNSGGPFVIDQRPEDGGLYVRSGVVCSVAKTPLTLYSHYNSKKPYPLLCANNDWEEIWVFHDDGGVTEEFGAYVQSLLTELPVEAPDS